MPVQRFYLIKISGSSGNVYDFSNAQIVDHDQLIEEVKILAGEIMDYDKGEFKYSGFDSRINFHVYNFCCPYRDGSFDGYPQHFCWVYSTSAENPFLSEFDDKF